MDSFQILGLRRRELLDLECNLCIYSIDQIKNQDLLYLVYDVIKEST